MPIHVRPRHSLCTTILLQPLEGGVIRAEAEEAAQSQGQSQVTAQMLGVSQVQSYSWGRLFPSMCCHLFLSSTFQLSLCYQLVCDYFSLPLCLRKDHRPFKHYSKS